MPAPRVDGRRRQPGGDAEDGDRVPRQPEAVVADEAGQERHGGNGQDHHGGRRRGQGAAGAGA